MSDKNNQQVVVSEKDKKEMMEIIAEEVIANDVDGTQVREIVTCKNIEMGEKKAVEFKGVLRLNGKFVPKVGRPLGLAELEKEMPTMFERIENIEGNPRDVIEDDKELTSGLTVASNEETALRRINASIKNMVENDGVEPEVAELIKKQLLKERELLKEEIRVVETMGVIWNENLVWDIWMIKRGIRQRAYMEQEGLPVDYLIELYGYIPQGEYKKIKKHYQKRFE